jgi:hypothetical protein
MGSAKSSPATYSAKKDHLVQELGFNSWLRIPPEDIMKVGVYSDGLLYKVCIRNKYGAEHCFGNRYQQMQLAEKFVKDNFPIDQTKST